MYHGPWVDAAAAAVVIVIQHRTSSAAADRPRARCREYPVPTHCFHRRRLTIDDRPLRPCNRPALSDATGSCAEYSTADQWHVQCKHLWTVKKLILSWRWRVFSLLAELLLRIWQRQRRRRRRRRGTVSCIKKAHRIQVKVQLAFMGEYTVTATEQEMVHYVGLHDDIRMSVICCFHHTTASIRQNVQLDYRQTWR